MAGEGERQLNQVPLDGCPGAPGVMAYQDVAGAVHSPSKMARARVEGRAGGRQTTKLLAGRRRGGQAWRARPQEVGVHTRLLKGQGPPMDEAGLDAAPGFEGYWPSPDPEGWPQLRWPCVEVGDVSRATQTTCAETPRQSGQAAAPTARYGKGQQPADDVGQATAGIWSAPDPGRPGRRQSRCGAVVRWGGG